MSNFYTKALPQKDGYYWVTREDLSFGIIVNVVFDEIDSRKEEPIICMPGSEVYRLTEFIQLREPDTLWCGPLKEPKRK